MRLSAIEYFRSYSILRVTAGSIRDSQCKQETRGRGNDGNDHGNNRESQRVTIANAKEFTAQHAQSKERQRQSRNQAKAGGRDA